MHLHVCRIPFGDVKDEQPAFSSQLLGFSVTYKILKYHDQTTWFVISTQTWQNLVETQSPEET